MELLLRIKSLDVMAQPVNLKIGGQNGIKTFFGLSMTVLYILTMAGVMICLGWNYFDSSDPIVTTHEVRLASDTKLRLSNYGWAPAIFGVDLSGKLMSYTELLRYVTPVLVKSTPATTTSSSKSTTFTAKSCAQILSDPTFSVSYSKQSTKSRLFSLDAKTSALCFEISQNEFFLTVPDSEVIEPVTVSVEYHPCSLGAGNCATASDLGNVKIVTLEPRVIVDYADKKNPVKITYTFSRAIRLTEELTQTLSHTLSINKLEDDSGLPFPVESRGDWLAESYSAYASAVRVPSVGTVTQAMVESRTTKPLAVVSYIASQTQQIIKRRYPNLLGVIGLIGGVAVILYVFLSTLTRMYTSCIRDSVLVDAVYPHLSSEASITKVLAQNMAVTAGNSPQICSTDSWHKLREQAASHIKTSLDLEHQVRRATKVEALTQMLLNQPQQKVLPVIAVAIQARLDAELEAQKAQQDNSLKIQESLKAIKSSYESVQGLLIEELSLQQKANVYLISELLNPSSLVGQLFFQFNNSNINPSAIKNTDQPSKINPTQNETENLRRVERFQIDDDIDSDGLFPLGKLRQARQTPAELRSNATQATRPVRVHPKNMQLEEMATYDYEGGDFRDPRQPLKFSEVSSPVGPKGRYPANQMVQLSRLPRENNSSVMPNSRNMEGARPVVVWISPDDPNYPDPDDSRYQIGPQRPPLINQRRDDSFEMYDPRVVSKRPHRATVPRPRYY